VSAPGGAVQGDRLWGDLMAMAEVGATPAGGSRRLALTDEDRAGRELFAGWARDAGLELRADRTGNVFARRHGSDPGRPAVMAGSHLDTQPDGGRFDGVFGVLAALEAVRALNDAGIQTKAPIEVVNWTNEEGGRFPRFCTGSAVYAGVMTLDEARSLEAFDGPLYGDELDRLGLAGDYEPGPAAAYLELHIEQGPKLERAGVPLGIVQGIRGIRQLPIEVTGHEAHSGSPMEGRQDALREAARIVEAVAELAESDPGEPSITVGRFEVEPNAPSVVPGRVRMVADVRGGGLEDPGALVDKVRAIAADANAGDPFFQYGPVHFDERLLTLLRESAGHTPTLEMVSPAGHDAGWVARKVPTAMLFVPCRNGLSHHPDEYAEPEHLELATRVLAETLAKLAAE
jgi:beta-ureidopropionase / N-carbamoyl-L-amino-acid hydrolase